MPSLDELLQKLWEDFVGFNPHALAIHDLLAKRGETVVNDHIAFRTYDHPKLNIKVLARSFIEFGYQARGDYCFEAKKLNAKHYEHPESSRPKVFISELKLAECSENLNRIVLALIDQVDSNITNRFDLPVTGQPWEVSFADYQRLADESEYAAWLAAFGFRANHFTVDVGAMEGFESLEQFNAFLKEAGFEFNSSGGEIKGSPQLYLEQSSTLAGEVEVRFSDGPHRIPACYYEFARRHLLPDGSRFEGFVARSADKIFESTDRRES